MAAVVATTNGPNPVASNEVVRIVGYGPVEVLATFPKEDAVVAARLVGCDAPAAKAVTSGIMAVTSSGSLVVLATDAAVGKLERTVCVSPGRTCRFASNGHSCLRRCGTGVVVSRRPVVSAMVHGAPSVACVGRVADFASG